MQIGSGFGLPGLTPFVSTSPAQQVTTRQAVQAGAAQPAPAAGSASAGPDNIAQEKALANVMNQQFATDCQTCKNRKYQDGSDDSGVSFQTPQHIDPGASAAVVASHEQEHVTRNAAKAEAEGGEVVSSSVVLHGDICPECGTYYVAGGTTYTTTRHGGHNNQQDMENQAASGGLDLSV